jgi:carbamoyltransferase
LNILGLSFDYHDAAAALIVDGEIVAAAQEERFSRIKHDANLPKMAADFCLAQAGLTPAQIDIVAFYERPLVKLDRIIQSALTPEGVNQDFLNQTVQSWIQTDRLGFRTRISRAFGISADKIRTISHHEAHAASTFFCSPYDKATIITLDGVGEWETMTVSRGSGRTIEKLYSIHFPDSLGLLYSAFTAFLGFEVNEGEYKVMGMAAFGKPVHADAIRELVELTDDGRFRLDQSYFSFKSPTLYPFTTALSDRFGPPREPELAFEPGDPNTPPTNDLETNSRHYADIAASIQLVTEEVIAHVVSSAVERTGIPQVAFAGGVALNSAANGKIKRMLDGELFVQPAAGDAGGALGAALWQAFAVGAEPRPPAMRTAYLGQAWDNDQIAAALHGAGVRTFKRYNSFEELAPVLADILSRNLVIGWFQGRFEWGPRSLGARSILASPTQASMKRVVNEKIKFREPFRPFAPAVLEERAHEYFEMNREISEHAPENFMLAVVAVKPDQQSRIPAVTHADGSARVQLVRRDVSPRFHALISAFADRTGVPVLLNTSFNLRGEPIVTSPYDALNTFAWSGMDFLVLENCLVSREDISWL